MTIQDLLSIILSRLKLIILFTVLGAILAFGYSKYFMTELYQTSIQLYVKSSTDTSTATATVAQIQNAKQLVESYIVVLQHNTVYERVARKLSEEYDISDLEKYGVPMSKDAETGEMVVDPYYIQGCVGISAVEDTEFLNISATTEYKELAAAICNCMAEVAPDILKRVVKAGTVEPLAAAKVPGGPISPNVKKITLVGALVGLIGSIAIVVVINLFNNKVTTANELKEKFGVPILAEIPSFNAKFKKGAYK